MKKLQHTVNRGLAAALFPLFLALAFAGCEGPQGPPGEGIGNLDTQDPTVLLTDPSRSSTVYDSVLVVAATASDNEDVAYVDFYLDGRALLGPDSVARDSSAPYRIEWNLVEAGYEFGTYPLIARAVDFSDNVGDSPPLLVTYAERPNELLLSYFDEEDEWSYFTLPDRFGDRYLNVRFSPGDSCLVREVHLDILDPLTAEIATGPDDTEPLQGGCDLTVFLWESGEDLLPVRPAVDSVDVAEGDVDYEGWTVVDVTELDVRVGAGEEFHAGLSPDSDQSYQGLFDARRAMPVLVSLDSDPLSEPTQHRSSEFDPERGWGTLQQHWGQKIDLHIRVLVAYPDGQVQSLAPSGITLERAAGRELLSLPGKQGGGSR